MYIYIKVGIDLSNNECYFIEKNNVHKIYLQLMYSKEIL